MRGRPWRTGGVDVSMSWLPGGSNGHPWTSADRRVGSRPRNDRGATGDRTPDLRIANAALSQLSYCPKTGAAGRARKGRGGRASNESGDDTPPPSEVKRFSGDSPTRATLRAAPNR